MNRLQGMITSVETDGNLSIVNVLVGVNTLSAIVIDTPGSASYLQQDISVSLLFKETEVIVCKQKPTDISIENQLSCTIKSIETSKILSKITLMTERDTLVSLITTQALQQLKLSSGDDVYALIKTNEIMLSPW